jgi:hypothetical protein
LSFSPFLSFPLPVFPSRTLKFLYYVSNEPCFFSEVCHMNTDLTMPWHTTQQISGCRSEILQSAFLHGMGPVTYKWLRIPDGDACHPDLPDHTNYHYGNPWGKHLWDNITVDAYRFPAWIDCYNPYSSEAT